MKNENTLGWEPGEVVRPQSIEDVQKTLSAGKSVLPWGGGTGQDHGHLPTRADIVLDFSEMRGILAHEPGDLTVTVEAGATLAKIQRKIGLYDQFLPLDPPHAAEATVGGIIAVDAFGPGRLGYGTVRDWLIGLTVVDARGRVIRGGGKVVKNVTGYDLPKIHVGALGTLGVIVEATFKVAPLPESSAVLIWRRPPGAIEPALPRDAARTVVVDFLGETREQLAYATLEGPREVVDAAVAAQPDAERFSAAPDTDFDVPLHLRIAGSPSESMARHAALFALAPGVGAIKTLPGTGHTDLLLAGDDLDALAIAAARVLGWAKQHSASFCVVHAPAAVRRDLECWWPQPPAFALMQRLKQSLDSDGVLNPGRFVGGI